MDDRGFARAQWAYDNALPPEGSDDDYERDEDAYEAAMEQRAEQAREDAMYDHDREEW